MLRISQETLRELDTRELAVCRAGSTLDALEASHTLVASEDYSKALAAWKLEVTALMEVRNAILDTLTGIVLKPA